MADSLASSQQSVSFGESTSLLPYFLLGGALVLGGYFLISHRDEKPEPAPRKAARPSIAAQALTPKKPAKPHNIYKITYYAADGRQFDTQYEEGVPLREARYQADKRISKSMEADDPIASWTVEDVNDHKVVYQNTRQKLEARMDRKHRRITGSPA